MKMEPLTQFCQVKPTMGDLKTELEEAKMQFELSYNKFINKLAEAVVQEENGTNFVLLETLTRYKETLEELKSELIHECAEKEEIKKELEAVKAENRQLKEKLGKYKAKPPDKSTSKNTTVIHLSNTQEIAQKRHSDKKVRFSSGISRQLAGVFSQSKPATKGMPLLECPFNSATERNMNSGFKDPTYNSKCINIPSSTRNNSSGKQWLLSTFIKDGPYPDFTAYSKYKTLTKTQKKKGDTHAHKSNASRKESLQHIRHSSLLPINT